MMLCLFATDLVEYHETYKRAEVVHDRFHLSFLGFRGRVVS